MEANRYSWRTNGHACDAPTELGYYEHCDSSAKCGVDQVHYEGFGPGATMIDTNSPFHTKIDFKAEESTNGQTLFAGYVVTLTQDDRTFKMDSATSSICKDESYLNAMTDDIDGNMVITMSIWGADPIDWLQHGACTGECTADSVHRVTNIKVTTAEYSKKLHQEQAEDIQLT